MPVDDILKLLMVCSVVVLPATAITLRFAIKPIVDAILRMKEGGVLPRDGAQVQLGGEVAQVRAELRELRDEMAQLQHGVAQLRDVESFHRALQEPQAELAGLPAGN